MWRTPMDTSLCGLMDIKNKSSLMRKQSIKKHVDIMPDDFNHCFKVLKSVRTKLSVLLMNAVHETIMIITECAIGLNSYKSPLCKLRILVNLNSYILQSLAILTLTMASVGNAKMLEINSSHFY